MGFRLDIPDIVDAVNETLGDMAKLVNPYTTLEFFRDLKQPEAASVTAIILWAIPSLLACAFLDDVVYLSAALFVALLVGLWYGNYMNRLLLLLGLSVFFGYFLHPLYFSPVRYSIITSMKLGYIYWMVSVFVPALVGLILHSSGKHLVGRNIGRNEANALVVYPLAPALISGIFRLFLETTVLHYLVLAYSIYILYLGIKTRFGLERAVYCFLVLVLASSIAGMLLFLLSVLLLNIPAPYY